MRFFAIIIAAFLFVGGVPGSRFDDDDKAQRPEATQKRKPNFTISKETTYVTEPVDDEGYIDYMAALNKKLSEGVSTENNAVVLLCQAFGPRPEGGPALPEFYKWLGIEEPPESGEYFLRMRQLMKGEGDEANEARKKFYDQLDDVMKSPWQRNQYPEIADWLAKNERPLQVLVEACKRPRYYYPLVPPKTEKGRQSLISCPLPHVQCCREAANALLARAMLALGRGDVEAAWKDLLACHRLARLVGEGGTLIEGLVGLAIDGLACTTDRAFLAAASVNAETLRNSLRELKSLPALKPAAERVNLAERFMLLDVFVLTDKHGIGSGVILGKDTETDMLADLFYSNVPWDGALRNANRWYDRLVAAMRQTDRNTRQAQFEAFEKDIVALKEKTVKPSKLKAARMLLSGEAKGEAVGNILICMLLPAVQKVQTAEDRHQQYFGNLHLAFALAIYHREHGRYPEKLDVLAPKYLPDIPQDLFSGKSVFYKPDANGYLLYSVGPNGIDDGGKFYGAEPPGDDIGFRMPPADVKQNSPDDRK